VWALGVVLRDGRVVTASGTSRGQRDARPETLAAIRQAAERHAIPAELTGTAAKQGSRESSRESPANPGLYPDPGGQPGLRRWDGRTWSPFLLQADPASGKPGRVKAPAEVWSPLAGSEPQRSDAADRVRRAGIVFAVWLAVTAVAAAVTVALYARDLSKPQADFSLAVVALSATVLALVMAWGAGERRKNLRKIDQAGKAATAYGEIGDRRGSRVRQVTWALVPIVSFTILAWWPFLVLALIRRRARDWAVFAAYLAAVVAEIVLFTLGVQGILPTTNAVIITVYALVLLVAVTASVHALVAFRPAAGLPSLSDADVRASEARYTRC